MGKISVLLVDDHPVVRQGIAALLSAHEDIQVAGEAGDGREALAMARQLQPQVVLLDLALPLVNGVQVTRRLHQDLPNVHVLVLTSYGHDEYIRQALEAGAHGYLLKKTAADELVKAVHEVAAGRSFYSAVLAKNIARIIGGKDSRRAVSSRGGKSSLTLREGQLLQLIADGYSNKEVAKELGISVKTVEKHRQKLMNKLGIHETAGLTRYALALESL
jgi:DNA-binding NarL/FixJ family response regulator